MKRTAKIDARKRPLTTRLLVVGWLVASPGSGMALKDDYDALQDAKASGCILPGECSPMLLFHPNRALKGTLKADVE